MTEEQFNNVAYSYRSWPAHDPKGVAERYEELWSLFRQQQAEIEALKDEVATWKMSYENCHRMCSGYGMN